MRAGLVIGSAVTALVVAATAVYVWARPATDTVTVGLTEPASLLPGLVDDAAGRLVTGALWTPLTEVDAAGRPVPRLAESVTSPDQRIWTVRLRPGWRFHDGTAVTAASVAGAWRANLTEGWRGAGLLVDILRVRGARPGAADVPGLRIADERTVEVTLDEPFAELPLVLSAPALQPLPEQVLASRDWTGFATRPVGTGPYRLAGPWRAGQGASLVRFDGYAAAAPAKARLDLRVQDPATQYDRARAGDLDLATEVPTEQHESMGRTFGARNRTWPLAETTYLGFAAADPRFAGPAVRRAISLALDRSAMATGPLGHRVSPLTALVPPAVPGARAAACLACHHDEVAARAALAEAGGLPATPVHLWYGPTHAAWVDTFASQLARALGTTVQPERLGGQPPTDGLLLIDHTVAYPSPYPILTSLVAGRDPELDRLRTTAAANPDPDARLRDYRLAENIALRDLPVIPLWSRHGHAVWSTRITTVTDTPLSAPMLDRTR